MRGPNAKDPKLRTRRNKPATKAELKSRRGQAVIPELPIRICPRLRYHGAETEEIVTAEKTNRRGRPRKKKTVVKVPKAKKGEPQCQVCGDTGVMIWHPETTEWWAELWEGHLGAEYIDIDRFAFYQMVKVMDRMNWSGHDPGLKDMCELRLWFDRFGLNPMARRSLQWAKPEDEEQKQADVAAQRAADEEEDDPEDPRNILKFDAGAKK